MARAASTNPATIPTGGGAPVEVPVAVYVDDSALAQSGPESAPSLRRVVNATGLVYYFLGLARRAKKCLWIRLVWCLGILTRMKDHASAALVCDAWTVDWATDPPVISPAKPVLVVEYDHDDEFRNLGYTASLTSRSRTAEKALTTLAWRAARIFATKPNLRDCGASIVPSVVVPKTVYHSAFGEATVAAVEETERGYGDITRQSPGVAKGFPWNVLADSLEYGGLGALQLATEVTKARLRQFQSMITSSASADCSVEMTMVSLAQRWCGSSAPVNMLSADEIHLREPLDATAPLAAHMFHERLGYKMAVGWVVRPPAAGDETIYDAYMREAGITGRTEAEIARLTGRQAAEPPSRQASEPASKRQESDPASSAPVLRTVPTALHDHDVQTPPCSVFHFLSSTPHSRTWPFVVARATHFRMHNHNHRYQPGCVRGATIFARFTH